MSKTNLVEVEEAGSDEELDQAYNFGEDEGDRRGNVLAWPQISQEQVEEAVKGVLNGEFDNAMFNQMLREKEREVMKKAVANRSNDPGNVYKVKYEMETGEFGILQLTFPEFNLKAAGTMKHTHPYAANCRALVRELMLRKAMSPYNRMVIPDSLGTITSGTVPNMVKDLGGSPLQYIFRDIHGIHVCAPRLSGKDAARWANYYREIEKFERENSVLTYNQKKMITEFKKVFNGGNTGVDTTDFICINKSQNCKVKANVMLAIHSLYDVRLEELAEAMDVSGASTCYAVLNFDDGVLCQTDGMIAHQNMCWRTNTLCDNIEFYFYRDPQTSYVHKFSVYSAWFLHNYIITKSNTAYSIERMNNRSGSLELVISKLPAGYRFSFEKVRHNLWTPKENEDMTMVTYPIKDMEFASQLYFCDGFHSSFLMVPQPIRQMMYECQDNYEDFKIKFAEKNRTATHVNIRVKFPTALIMAAYGVALTTTEKKFKPGEILMYILAKAYRTVMGKSITALYANINVFEALIVAYAVYIFAYESRYYMGQSIKYAIEASTYNRKLEEANVCSKCFCFCRGGLLCLCCVFVYNVVDQCMYNCKRLQTIEYRNVLKPIKSNYAVERFITSAPVNSRYHIVEAPIFSDPEVIEKVVSVLLHGTIPSAPPMDYSMVDVNEEEMKQEYSFAGHGFVGGQVSMDDVTYTEIRERSWLCIPYITKERMYRRKLCELNQLLIMMSDPSTAISYLLNDVGHGGIVIVPFVRVHELLRLYNELMRWFTNARLEVHNNRWYIVYSNYLSCRDSEHVDIAEPLLAGFRSSVAYDNSTCLKISSVNSNVARYQNIPNLVPIALLKDIEKMPIDDDDARGELLRVYKTTSEGMQVTNNSKLKLLQIVEMVTQKLLVLQPNSNSMILGAGPGGWSELLNTYNVGINNQSNSTTKILACSLANNGNFTDVYEADNYLAYERDHPSFDLLNSDELNKFFDFARCYYSNGFELLLSDVGISSAHNEQAYSFVRLLAVVLRSVLEFVNIGGRCVVKFYVDLEGRIFKLIDVVAKYFLHVYFCRPRNTGKHTKEMYVVMIDKIHRPDFNIQKDISRLSRVKHINDCTWHVDMSKYVVVYDSVVVDMVTSHVAVVMSEDPRLDKAFLELVEFENSLTVNDKDVRNVLDIEKIDACTEGKVVANYGKPMRDYTYNSIGIDTVLLRRVMDVNYDRERADLLRDIKIDFNAKLSKVVENTLSRSKSNMLSEMLVGGVDAKYRFAKQKSVTFAQYVRQDYLNVKRTVHEVTTKTTGSLLESTKGAVQKVKNLWGGWFKKKEAYQISIVDLFTDSEGDEDEVVDMCDIDKFNRLCSKLNLKVAVNISNPKKISVSNVQVLELVAETAQELEDQLCVNLSETDKFNVVVDGLCENESESSELDFSKCILELHDDDEYYEDIPDEYRDAIEDVILSEPEVVVEGEDCVKDLCEDGGMVECDHNVDPCEIVEVDYEECLCEVAKDVMSDHTDAESETTTLEMSSDVLEYVQAVEDLDLCEVMTADYGSDFEETGVCSSIEYQSIDTCTLAEECVVDCDVAVLECGVSDDVIEDVVATREMEMEPLNEMADENMGNKPEDVIMVDQENSICPVEDLCNGGKALLDEVMVEKKREKQRKKNLRRKEKKRMERSKRLLDVQTVKSRKYGSVSSLPATLTSSGAGDEGVMKGSLQNMTITYEPYVPPKSNIAKKKIYNHKQNQKCSKDDVSRLSTKVDKVNTIKGDIVSENDIMNDSDSESVTSKTSCVSEVLSSTVCEKYNLDSVCNYDERILKNVLTQYPSGNRRMNLDLTIMELSGGVAKLLLFNGESVLIPSSDDGVGEFLELNTLGDGSCLFHALSRMTLTPDRMRKVMHDFAMKNTESVKKVLDKFKLSYDTFLRMVTDNKEWGGTEVIVVYVMMTGYHVYIYDEVCATRNCLKVYGADYHVSNLYLRYSGTSAGSRHFSVLLPKDEFITMAGSAGNLQPYNVTTYFTTHNRTSCNPLIAVNVRDFELLRGDVFFTTQQITDLLQLAIERDCQLRLIVATEDLLHPKWKKLDGMLVTLESHPCRQQLVVVTIRGGKGKFDHRLAYNKLTNHVRVCGDCKVATSKSSPRSLGKDANIIVHCGNTSGKVTNVRDIASCDLKFVFCSDLKAGIVEWRRDVIFMSDAPQKMNMTTWAHVMLRKVSNLVVNKVGVLVTDGIAQDKFIYELSKVYPEVEVMVQNGNEPTEFRSVIMPTDTRHDFMVAAMLEKREEWRTHAANVASKCATYLDGYLNNCRLGGTDYVLDKSVSILDTYTGKFLVTAASNYGEMECAYAAYGNVKQPHTHGKIISLEKEFLKNLGSVSLSEMRDNYYHKGITYLVMCKETKLMLEEKFYSMSAKYAYLRDISRLRHAKAVLGVPGAGKTTWIINNHNLNDGVKTVVLTVTRRARDDLQKRVQEHRKKLGLPLLDTKMLNLKYRTVDSFLIQHKNIGYASGIDNLMIDEVFMVHPGTPIWAMYLAKAMNVVCVGDMKQISYYSRGAQSIQHTNLMKLKFDEEQYLTVSHRVPMDVAYGLDTVFNSDRIPGDDKKSILTTNKICESMEVVHVSGVATLPNHLKSNKANVQFLTFTTHDKQTCIANGYTKTLTITEFQGQQAEHVVLLRLSPAQIELFSNLEQITVGISRHTKRFTYATVLRNDKLSLGMDKIMRSGMEEKMRYHTI